MTLQFLLTNMDHNAKITDQGAKIPTSPPTEAVANGNTNLTNNMVHPNSSMTTKEENIQNPLNQSEINLNYLEELRKKNSSALLSRMDVTDQNGIENRKIAITYAGTFAFSQKWKIVCETYFRGKFNTKFRI